MPMRVHRLAHLDCRRACDDMTVGRDLVRAHHHAAPLHRLIAAGVFRHHHDDAAGDGGKHLLRRTGFGGARQRRPEGRDRDDQTAPHDDEENLHQSNTTRR